METLTAPTHTIQTINEVKPVQSSYIEYDYFDGVASKRIVKDGKTVALFECDENELPTGSLKESARKYWFETYETPLLDSQMYEAVCEFLQFEDNYNTIGRRPVWIRCSIDGGVLCALFVANDAFVCESCDKALGCYTAEQIWAAYLTHVYEFDKAFIGNKGDWALFSLAVLNDYLKHKETPDVAPQPENEAFWANLMAILER